METTPPGFEFEQPMLDIEIQLKQLEQSPTHSPDEEQQINALRRKWTETTRKIYGELSPWQIVQVSRHKDRPYTKDYLNLAFDEFVELHGDKFFGDDRAMLTGFAKLGRHKVMVVGHQKGRTYKERSACHFGCASGRLPQSHVQDEDGRKVRAPHHLLHRHSRCLPRSRCRRTRANASHRREHVPHEPTGSSHHLRGHRGRGVRRGVGNWRG